MVMKLMGIINVNFALFNIMPLPPLDGSRILMALLPGRWVYELLRLERYMFILIILLFVIGPLGSVLGGVSQRILYGMQYFIVLFL